MQRGPVSPERSGMQNEPNLWREERGKLGAANFPTFELFSSCGLSLSLRHAECESRMGIPIR